MLADQLTGELVILVDGDSVDPKELGRIAAQNVYQIIMQKIKEAENDVIFGEFKEKEGNLASGVVRRIERTNIWLNLGNVDGLLPYSEQVRGEKFQLGERIRCVIKEVNRDSNVSVILSRSSPQLVRCLFELEIPDISNHTIEIMAAVREPGVRSKVAVHSSDLQVDCIGACVGVKGSRIWAVINEINEKIDIVRWADDARLYIANSLSPAEISSVELCPAISRARVLVKKDQVPLAIGKNGLNIQLSSRLTGWHLDLYDTQEIDEIKERGKKELDELPGVGKKIRESIQHYHIATLEELVIFGEKKLVEVKGISEAKAEQIIQAARDITDQRKKEKENRKSKSKQNNIKR